MGLCLQPPPLPSPSPLRRESARSKPQHVPRKKKWSTQTAREREMGRGVVILGEGGGQRTGKKMVFTNPHCRSFLRLSLPVIS